MVSDFVAESLSIHKRPRQVCLVDSLPRNAMGKVQKKLLTPEGVLVSLEACSLTAW